MNKSNQPSKLGIIVPLKSKRVSRNWDATCQRLTDTVASIRNQSCDRYEAIVVGHESPSEMLWDQRIRFESIETPAPTLEAAVEFANDNQRFTLDKNRKIVRGMQILNSPMIRYWFALDADDLIHRDFVQHVFNAADALDQVEGSNDFGWLIDGGYLFYMPQRRFTSVNKLDQLCGSTSVLNAAHCRVPKTLDPDDLREHPWCQYSHRDMDQYYLSQWGVPASRLMQPLVAYVLGHGDNCSDGYRVGFSSWIKSFLKPRLQARRIASELAHDFAIK